MAAPAYDSEVCKILAAAPAFMAWTCTGVSAGACARPGLCIVHKGSLLCLIIAWPQEAGHKFLPASYLDLTRQAIGLYVYSNSSCHDSYSKSAATKSMFTDSLADCQGKQHLLREA